MIPLETILGFYPKPLFDQAIFRKYLLKEYIQLLILDYLSTSPWLRKGSGWSLFRGPELAGES